MSTDAKLYGKKRRKRRFHGNQFTKKESKTSETSFTVVSGFDSAGAVDNVVDAECHTHLLWKETVQPIVYQQVIQMNQRPVIVKGKVMKRMM